MQLKYIIAIALVLTSQVQGQNGFKNLDDEPECKDENALMLLDQIADEEWNKSNAQLNMVSFFSKMQTGLEQMKCDYSFFFDLDHLDKTVQIFGKIRRIVLRFMYNWMDNIEWDAFNGARERYRQFVNFWKAKKADLYASLSQYDDSDYRFNMIELMKLLTVVSADPLAFIPEVVKAVGNGVQQSMGISINPNGVLPQLVMMGKDLGGNIIDNVGGLLKSIM